MNEPEFLTGSKPPVGNNTNNPDITINYGVHTSFSHSQFAGLVAVLGATLETRDAKISPLLAYYFALNFAEMSHEKMIILKK